MNIETLDDLFAHRLETLYSVELAHREILNDLEAEVSIDALDATGDDTLREELRSLVADHRERTDSHVERIETVFEQVGRQPNSREVPALAGLVEEKQRFNNVVLNDAYRPAYYIEFMKLLERSEIIAYESLLDIAAQLELDEAATDPLEATLAEEQTVFDRLESYSPYEVGPD